MIYLFCSFLSTFRYRFPTMDEIEIEIYVQTTGRVAGNNVNKPTSVCPPRGLAPPL
jgi:hypothetical protein